MKAGLTLELAIFTALFPHGRGGFGGISETFVEYLRCVVVWGFREVHGLMYASLQVVAESKPSYVLIVF